MVHYPLKQLKSVILICTRTYLFRFTAILGDTKFQGDTHESRKSCRLSPMSSPTAWVYPKECNLCSKLRVQYKSKKFEPYKIANYDAERTLKAAAKAKVECMRAGRRPKNCTNWE